MLPPLSAIEALFDADCCHTGTAIGLKHPGQTGLSRHLQWASECPNVKNYKWRLNPVWHRMLYSCTRMATVGVKGLTEPTDFTLHAKMPKCSKRRKGIWTLQRTVAAKIFYHHRLAVLGGIRSTVDSFWWISQPSVHTFCNSRHATLRVPGLNYFTLIQIATE